MSLQALMLAARDTLRTGMGLTPAQCEVMTSPEPPPAAGQLFLAVTGGGGWSNSAKECLDERFGFKVTVSLKIADAPVDRAGPHRLTRAQTGLLSLCEVARAALHGNWNVVYAANKIIGAAADGFCEPPRFRDAGNGEPVERGPEWFGGKTTVPYRAAGLSMTLTFGDARRIQSFANLAIQMTGKTNLC